jgi:hypothetical protein
MFRGNLRNLTAATVSAAFPTTSFKWTINGGLTPINNIPQPSDWDCASALFYNRMLDKSEYLAVEYWLNEVRLAVDLRPSRQSLPTAGSPSGSAVLLRSIPQPCHCSALLQGLRGSFACCRDGCRGQLPPAGRGGPMHRLGNTAAPPPCRSTAS